MNNSESCYSSRLRDSVVALGMPAGSALARAASISGPPSSSSSSASGGGENVQVISIKSEASSSKRSNCVSKVLVNSTEPQQQHKRLSSASFSAGAHAFAKPQIVVNSSNVGLVMSQPSSLPALSSGPVKRSRSTSAHANPQQQQGMSKVQVRRFALQNF